MGITVALLAYKEAENLMEILPHIKRVLAKIDEAHEILVVDTAVPLDNTKDVCAQYGAIYINQEEPFFGGAFRTAIKYATMDKFLILDSDGSHNPENILEIYSCFLKEKADVVIGSRYVKGGKSNDKKSSYFMSKVLNGVFRLFLGIKAKDLSTDYRMYHTNQLKTVQLACSHYDILQEVLLKLKIGNSNFIIKEVPIEFQKRMFGESKRSLLLFVGNYIKTLIKLTVLRCIYSPHKKAKEVDKRAEFITNFILYMIIGVMAAVVDLGVFLLVNQFSYNRIPEVANLISSVSGFFCSFFLNTFLNFQKTSKLFLRFISYFLICFVGVILTTGLIYIFKDYIELTLLKVLCMLFVAVIQFVLNRAITYKKIV